MKKLRNAVGAALTAALLSGVGVVSASAIAAGAASASVNRPSSCYPLGSTNCGGKIYAPHVVDRGSIFKVDVTGFAADTAVKFTVCNIQVNTVTSSSSGSAVDPVQVPGAERLGACKIVVSGTGDKTSLTLTDTVAIKAISHDYVRLNHKVVTFGKEGIETISVHITPDAYPKPAGRVYVFANSRRICDLAVRGGDATCHLKARELDAGKYTLHATYGGDYYYTNSRGGAAQLTVKKVTKKTRRHHSINKSESHTVLRGSRAMVTYGKEAAEHFSVSIARKNGRVATGTVAIHLNRSRVLCRIRLRNGAGACTLRPKELRPGTYFLYATYGGSKAFYGSSSGRVKLVVKK